MLNKSIFTVLLITFSLTTFTQAGEKVSAKPIIEFGDGVSEAEVIQKLIDKSWTDFFPKTIAKIVKFAAVPQNMHIGNKIVVQMQDGTERVVMHGISDSDHEALVLTLNGALKKAKNENLGLSFSSKLEEIRPQDHLGKPIIGKVLDVLDEMAFDAASRYKRTLIINYISPE